MVFCILVMMLAIWLEGNILGTVKPSISFPFYMNL